MKLFLALRGLAVRRRLAFGHGAAAAAALWVSTNTDACAELLLAHALLCCGIHASNGYLRAVLEHEWPRSFLLG